MARKIDEPDKAQFIAPLNMNGLQGRVLRIPPLRKREREILLVYGHHAQLERWWGLVESLRRYGTVTMPDLPGFGGMDSFYKIRKKPSLDNYADYLAAFIRMRYKRRRLTIVCMPFGFAVVTRTLQRYPDIASKVDVLVSVMGVMHRDDLSLPPAKRKLLRLAFQLLALPPISIAQTILLRALPLSYRPFAALGVHTKRWLAFDPFLDGHEQEVDRQLWLHNDIRSHWYAASELLRLDNCRSHIELPVWQLHQNDDSFMHRSVTEQHLLIAYKAVRVITINWPAAGTTVKGARPFELPIALRRTLS